MLPLMFSRDLAGLGLLWLAVLVSLLVLFFATGLFFEYLTSRHPERRIQNREFSDRRQDITRSVVSLVSISAYVALGVWLQQNGYALFAIWQPGLVSIAVGMIISLVLYDAWFYWFHRLMHTRAFYRFHARHHVSIAPTAWSNNNDTQIGTFFEQSFFLVAPLILPFPPVVFLVHKVWDQVTGMIGHVGYEFFASPTARYPWPGVSTTYHDQHHAFFNYNFANTFTLWDRLCGTLHRDYDARVKAFEELATAEKTRGQ